MSGPWAMGRMCWRLTDLLSSVLDPDEREVVRGDLAEAGETGSQALRDVLGLVARRQATLWRDWPPWLILLGLVVPLGVLLSLVSRSTADDSAIYLWLYVNNWNVSLLRTPGFWPELLQCVPGVFTSYIALICWSWTSGYLLASLSRRTIWFNGALFCLVLACAEFLGAPRDLGHSLLLSRARDFQCNAAAFTAVFYRVMFPPIVQTVLVVLPALWGMRQSIRLGKLPPLFKAIQLIFALAAIATLATEASVWWQLRVWEAFPLRFPRLPSLMPFAVVGPAGYAILAASLQLWGNRKVVS